MSTYKIVMQHKNDSGNYDTLLPKSSGGRFINISTVAGATLSVTGPNSYSQTYILSSSENTHGFAITDDGNYTLKVTNNSKSSSKAVTINDDGIFSYILYPFSSVLNNNTWKEISQASSLGIASSLWNVGDVKMDAINGTFANTTINGDYGFFIIDFDHNSNIEGKGISFMGFKTAISNGTDVCFIASNYDSYQNTTQGFVMNQANSSHDKGTNANGWKSSYMRTSIIPSFKQALSSDLRSVLKTVTIYSDNIGGGQNNSSYVTSTTDDIYLAAEYEITGSINYANPTEKNYQTQFTYYKNGNNKIKYKHNSISSSAFWWERSPSLGAVAFCCMGQAGATYYSYASTSYGFAPVFRV